MDAVRRLADRWIGSAARSAVRIGLLLVWIFAASSANAQSLNEGIEYFEKHIRPLLVEHCYECHAGTEVEGGLRVDSWAGLARGGDSGPAVVRGKPDESRLLKAISYRDEYLQMPPAGRLSNRQIALVRRWIEMGAPDPRDEPPAASREPVARPGTDWWAFQPVQHVRPPSVEDDGWVRTPVDAFVLQRLQAAGLAPAPQADRRTLIRRLTFDLTGLPPTRDEIAAFLADQRPDAYDRLVDRLLNSPRYGERWGRHWLDVARYADSNGLDENLAYGNAWRYRDYVIRSFNEDKPFARFLIEQMAGDLLPDANPMTRTATGFLALGAKVLAEPDEEKLRMDTIDEQIDTTGKVWLGIGLGCARCHDHKFDPVSQAEYYALAAIFKGTRTFAESKTGAIHHWYEHSFATPQQLEELKQIDAAIDAKKKAAATYKNQATERIRAEARSRVVDYLVAAAQLSPTATLREVEQVAGPAGLHPRILHHARLHLEYHRDDPFFAVWHDAYQRQDTAAIQAYYADVYAKVRAADNKLKQGDQDAGRSDEEIIAAARRVLEAPSGLLAVPTKPEFAFDQQTLQEYYRLMEEARLEESQAPDEPAAMGVCDGQVCPELPIHIRGSHHNLGPAVARGVPAAFSGDVPPPQFSPETSGRLELARWLADPRHPLVARVYVNRVWGWHFGRPLVATTENFGHLGERPTHPELLDFLASFFLRSGGSTKELHRLIVISSTYMMDSRHPNAAEQAASDPANRLLWRFPMRRLEAEAIRDAMLAIAGDLDRTMGGKTIPLRNRQFVFNHTSVDHTKYDSCRRAVYLPVIRNNLYPFFEQFNFPDPTMPTGRRASTVVAPQALWMMNAPLVLESAERWAERLLSNNADETDRVRIAFEAAYGRLPNEAEQRQVLTALRDFIEIEGGAEDDRARHRAWSLVCQSLFAANEFVYIR